MSTTTLPPEDVAEPEPPTPARSGPWVDPADLGRRVAARVAAVPAHDWLGLGAVVVGVAFVLATVHPDLILRDNTPTGGDMGAHVWGPMYLVRHLLPEGRLSGWSPDWYAGFPAFQFYMVIPMLAIVLLHVGVRSLLVFPALALAVSVGLSGWLYLPLHRWRRVLAGLGAFLFLAFLPVPYGVAFKIVAVSGLVALPVCCWAFAKLTDLPFPGQVVLPMAALFMIANREPQLNGGTGNIIGGNLSSTMAGEFSFSISLALLVLYLGVLVKGLRTGRHRALAAVLLALVGLCHLIPVFVALALTAVAVVVWPGRARLVWLAPVLVVAGLLSTWWVLPFLLRAPFVNDMGWRKLPEAGAKLADGSPQTVWDYLTPRAMLWPLGVAALGAVTSAIFRYRAGLMLVACAVGSAVGFVVAPQARLWNARLLPFYYLSLFMLGAIGVTLLLEAVAVLLARDPNRPGRLAGAIGGSLAVAAAVVFLGVPLGVLPGSTYPPTGGVDWKVGGTVLLHREWRNDVTNWSKGNFEGLEGKQRVGAGAAIPAGQGGWPELRDLVATMDRLGKDPDHGCGRSFWEYSNTRLNTYGTTMAPMLLPYFTDSCIGSMEGLYFESSATTPHHFLMQCALSKSGSCSQRDLAYQNFAPELGVSQLQLMGVRYYLAVTDEAIAFAASDDRLTEVAVSGPWHVYEVADAPLVQGLEAKPVVVRGLHDEMGEWLDPAASWFMSPDRWDVMMARAGPADWPRVDLPADPMVDPQTGLERRIGERVLPDFPTEAVPEVEVTDVREGDDSISFSVDRVGVPVLVKVSYFPNWQASGADGPYRVAPNLMVVVPTSEEVRLTYGRTPVDLVAYLLTLVGLVGLVWLARRPLIEMPVPRAEEAGPTDPFPWLSGEPGEEPAPGGEPVPGSGPVPGEVSGEEPAPGAEVGQPTPTPTPTPPPSSAPGPVAAETASEVERGADEPEHPPA